MFANASSRSPTIISAFICCERPNNVINKRYLFGVLFACCALASAESSYTKLWTRLSHANARHSMESCGRTNRWQLEHRKRVNAARTDERDNLVLCDLYAQCSQALASGHAQLLHAIRMRINQEATLPYVRSTQESNGHTLSKCVA